MDSFSTLPRVGQSLVCRSRDVTRDQRVHGLSCHISSCLTCTCYLGHLCIEHTLLVRVNLEGSQHIDLLDQERRCVSLSQLLGYLSKKPSRLCVLIGLPVELYSFHLLVFLYQVTGVLREKLLYLDKAVLLCQFDGQVPLIE